MSNLPNLPKANTVSERDSASAVADKQDALRVGNRKVVTDYYFHVDVANEQELYQNTVFVRLGAVKGTTFRKVSFMHCVFDGCYLVNCTFDSCNFTGCKFVGSNFHSSTFAGCKFWYVTFDRTRIDDDVLNGEAPVEENLRMQFARSLRMNFSQLGDAKAVNRAISVELQATELYLRRSWSSDRNYYYKNKYPGWKQFFQFLRWLEFKLLDVIWGNGESILKLGRSIILVIATIAIYDISTAGNALDLSAYPGSIKQAPGVFLGVASKDFSPLILALIGASRYISLALLTALLVKRFGRR